MYIFVSLCVRIVWIRSRDDRNRDVYCKCQLYELLKFLSQNQKGSSYSFLAQRIRKIRIDIRTSEMVTGPLPAWLGLFNQAAPMCQDAGNIMVALNPFAYGEGNLKDFRYVDGRWMGHVGGSDWRHWIVFSFPDTAPEFFAHDSYTMVKNLLLLADVTRLLKVGSLHSQNMNNKGWCDFVASMSIFLDWPLGYVLWVISTHCIMY